MLFFPARAQFGLIGLYLVAVCASPASGADRITLRNGTVLEGQDGMKGGGRVTMKTTEGQVTFQLSEVEKVEWDNREILEKLKGYWEIGGVNEFRVLSSRHANRFSPAEERQVREMQSTILSKKSAAKALVYQREQDRAADVRRTDEAKLAQATEILGRNGWRSASEFLLAALDGPDPLRECGYNLLKIYRTQASLDEMQLLTPRLTDLERKAPSAETRTFVRLLLQEHETFVEPLRLAAARAAREQMQREEAERLALEARRLAAAQAEARERVRQEAALKARQQDFQRQAALRREQNQRVDRFANGVVQAIVGGIAEGAAGEATARALGDDTGLTWQERAKREVLKNAAEAAAGAAARSLVETKPE